MIFYFATFISLPALLILGILLVIGLVLFVGSLIVGALLQGNVVPLGVALGALASASVAMVVKRRLRIARGLLFWIGRGAVTERLRDRVNAKAFYQLLAAEQGDPVPSGFVLSARCFHESLVRVDGEAGPQVVLGARLRARLRRALRRLGAPRIILRSSFPGEDGEQSFAGVYESVGGVDPADPDAVEAALRRVWASYWSTRAVDYRERLGITAAERPALAVLCQEQIEADGWGVASSVDGLRGDPEIQLVEVQRAGEAPLLLRRDRLRGLPWLPRTEPAQAEAEAWIEAHTDLLAWLSKRLLAWEAAVGGAVQLEWSQRSWQPFLYQVRPLTGAPERHTYASAFVVATNRKPLTPLSEELLFGSTTGPDLRPPGADAGSDAVVAAPSDSAPRPPLWHRHQGIWYVSYNQSRAGLNPYGPAARSWRHQVRAWSLLCPGGLRPARHALAAAASALDRWTLPEDLSQSAASLRELRDGPYDQLRRAQRLAVEAAGLAAGLHASFLSWLTRAELTGPPIPALPPAPEVEEEIALVPQSGAAQTPPTERPPSGERTASPSSPPPGLPPSFRPLFNWPRLLAGYLEHRLGRAVSLRDQVRGMAARANAAAARACVALQAQVDLPTWESPWQPVHFMTVDEAVRAAGDPEAAVAMRPTLEARRDRYEALGDAQPEPVLHMVWRSDALVEVPTETPPAEGVGRGLALSTGRARGRLRRVRTPTQTPAPTDDSPDILVLPDDRPQWGPLARRAGGVVVLRGAALGHLAMVCREAEIPGLLGLTGVDLAALEGAEVELDGAAGTLRRVDVA